jgi:methionyl-tRNA formyltransferase
MSLRAVFFGTPEFAVPSLEAILRSGTDVALVVTQPDRPAGRHATPLPAAVARLAAARGIPVEKPEKLRGNARFLETIRRVAPEVGVVVAYGRILPNALLDLPRLGFVNVHASLLPSHRGASPVAAAILAGDEEAGVATMRVVEELDAGPVYLTRRAVIGPEEDAGSLSARLAVLGAELLVETLRGLEAGTVTATPQSGKPSYCQTIRREDGEIDWTLPAVEIGRRLRAYTPWPGLYTFVGEERIKILGLEQGPGGRELPPGTLWSEGGSLFAAAGQGTSVRLLRLQRAGRQPVSGEEFARGARLPGRFGRASREGASPASV